MVSIRLTPPRQQWSAFGLPPLPPPVADVICERPLKENLNHYWCSSTQKDSEHHTHTHSLYDIPALQAIWQITANHGGGYQYRLCPASEKITEECFQKNPLRFDTSKQVFIDDLLSTCHCFCIFRLFNGTTGPECQSGEHLFLKAPCLRSTSIIITSLSYWY